MTSCSRDARGWTIGCVLRTGRRHARRHKVLSGQRQAYKCPTRRGPEQGQSRSIVRVYAVRLERSRLAERVCQHLSPTFNRPKMPGQAGEYSMTSAMRR